MKRRVAVLFLAGALGGFALAVQSCGNSGCSPSNCQGCCTNGTCFPGDTDTVCGGSGVACTACQSGVETCQMHICVTGSGGGGPLDDAGCESVPVVNLMPAVLFTPDAGGGFQAVDVFVGSPTSTATSSDFATVELYYLANTFPQGTRTVPLGAQTFQTCNDCVYYDEGCDPNGVNPCAHDYLARAGTLQIDAFVSSPGSIAGSASNLHFVEWNFQNDTPVDGGRCVDVGTMSYQGMW